MSTTKNRLATSWSGGRKPDEDAAGQMQTAKRQWIANIRVKTEACGSRGRIFLKKKLKPCALLYIS